MKMNNENPTSCHLGLFLTIIAKCVEAAVLYDKPIACRVLLCFALLCVLYQCVFIFVKVSSFPLVSFREGIRAVLVEHGSDMRSLVAGLSEPFRHLDKYPSVLQELERNMPVRAIVFVMFFWRLIFYTVSRVA